MVSDTAQNGVTVIENCEQLAKYLRLRNRSVPVTVQQIQDQFRLLVDKVMSEGGIYSPQHAALALKQTEGDPLEAAFYLRAYRSTLKRLPDSLPLNMEEMRVTRRISPIFKNIPGGQILGHTSDYQQRILDFSLFEEDAEKMAQFLDSFEASESDVRPEPGQHPKVVDILREQGFVKEYKDSPEQICQDITCETIHFPLSRSARLQMMARGETGGLLAIAYSGVRGFGALHPKIAELRVGYVPACIPHPYRKDETLSIGSIQLTEVETVSKFGTEADEKKPYLRLGYGISFGCNEVKAISMAILDRSMKEEEANAPCEDQEFVLYHTDGIESSGFCAHFKLPHYVSFQAELDRLKSAQAERKTDQHE